MSAAENLRTARASKTYATIDADTDLCAALTAHKRPCIRIRVGGAGNLALVYADGTTDVITDLLAGETLEVSARRITDAGTTATKITVFW
jgi:hypothetical protein